MSDNLLDSIKSLFFSEGLINNNNRSVYYIFFYLAFMLIENAYSYSMLYFFQETKSIMNIDIVKYLQRKKIFYFCFIWLVWPEQNILQSSSGVPQEIWSKLLRKFSRSLNISSAS